jgi:hypothetical protein
MTLSATVPGPTSPSDLHPTADALFCSHCCEWKPAAAFAPGHVCCRVCVETAREQARLRAVKVNATRTFGIEIECYVPVNRAAVARCALGELGGVAITGGMDTALYAVTESGALYEFDHGEWYPKDDYTDWATVFDVAYCTKVGDVIIVAGEEVK